jgi:uncharacterized damage-inducible protein DinB
MIDADYVRTLARYAAWQNESLIAAAASLSAEARRADRGAFFGSIEATLNHVLWADRIWMHRLAGHPKPHRRSIGDSIYETDTWEAYVAARRATDAAVADWAAALEDAAVAGDLVWYSGAAGREIAKPRGFVVVHVFNHQTHHRGQVHAMLTAAGARPDDTDLFLLA